MLETAWVWFGTTIIFALFYYCERNAHNFNLTELGNRYAKLVGRLLKEKRKRIE